MSAAEKLIAALAKMRHTTPEALPRDTHLATIGLLGYHLQAMMWEAGVDVSLSECANLFERVSDLIRYAEEHDARREKR